MTISRKTMHINLYDDQVDDYQLVREQTGITNDNDLVRFLFRQAANGIRASENGRARADVFPQAQASVSAEVCA